ncbi:MAG: hypothetical protein DI629_20975 [Mesorhizobium amorphae]|nr:MAG: hypothetical protein DI629_20975 [Mesorhizobium amorphae]
MADAERYVGTDFFGSDLFPKGVRGVSLGECERACAENDACAAYSYMNLPHQSRRLEGVSPQAARAAFGPTVPAG